MLNKYSKELTDYIVMRIKEYDQKNVDFANLTLARDIAKKFYNKSEITPEEYDVIVEKIRNRIRYYRGSIDKKGKHNIAYRDPSKAHDYIKKFVRNSINRKDAEFVMPKSASKVLILSDIHFPFHDLDCIHKALEYGLNKQMNAILLNGDIVDFFDISRWSKSGERVSMTEEKGILIEFLEYLNGFEVPVFYKYGNHEARWEQYINRQIPELAEDPHFVLENYLGLKDLGITTIQSRTLIKLGKLNVIHGHEFGETVFSPVNPARGLFLRAKASVLAGHYHQPSYHSESDLNGSTVGCWSTGCLSHLNPTYRPFAYTKWRHGFAFVEVEKNGNFHVHNKVIVEGEIV